MRFPCVTLLLLLAALAGCGERGESGEVWRFALEEVEGSVQWTYAQQFKSMVESRTDGEITVRIHPYGSLGTSADLTQQLRQGALQFAFASPGHLGSVVPEVQLLTLHFILSDDNRVNHDVLTGNERFNQLLDEAYRERGLTLYSIVPEGWMVWTAGKPLRTPADFDGVKIRTMVSPLLLSSYKAYGAKPSPMPYGEVYGALQMDMIDAQVNPVFAIQEMSFHEVQDAMTRARHAQFIATVASAPGFIDGLSGERRAMLDEIRGELAGFIFEKQRELNDQRLAMIEDSSDIEIVELGDSERAAFRERSLPVRDEYVELAGERGRKLLDTLLQAIEQADGAD
ncbi:TRAP transporter substrate-binding protein DctP [Spectribacter hydrogenoxidans]|uniref:TRAP transporter substrate-binding protein DctP n=1 Tax=Spectribacter hydrogenoxidans TaxID=3075608 RepID=A0ABU3BXE7_9GAMM|nr:TRAP transporter substrate-binding protein DctP [Salinisphaera sp. W335]MDT0633988.1 TRAP transporter substrate-binding protein DctP [Salinisphaera sp. W335]